MAPAQQDQVVEAGRAAVHPVLHVMGIAAAGRAARKSATLVTCLERAADRGRHGPSLAPDVEDCAGGAVVHRHDRGVAGNASRRLRGNVYGAVVHLQRPGQTFPCRHTRRSLHVQHNLVAVAGRPVVQVRGQRRLGQQTERVGSPLCRRHFLDHPFGLRRRLGLAEQPIGRRLERALDDRAYLGRQAAANDDHAVVVDPGRQLPMQVSRLGVCGCGRLIDPTPRADEAFDVGGSAGLREVEQRGLVLQRGHAGQRPHLGVGDRAAPPSWR